MQVDRHLSHNSWYNNLEDGTNVALLRLPQSVDVEMPKYNIKQPNLRPNQKLYALGFGFDIEVAQLVVVADERCPNINTMKESMFCAHSQLKQLHAGRLISQLCLDFRVSNRSL